MVNRRRFYTKIKTALLLGAALTYSGVADRALAQKPCTIVDTDLGLDDYRAIAIVLNSIPNVHFVVSEGVEDIPTSRVVLKAFLVKTGFDKNTSILVGKKLFGNGPIESPLSKNMDWLPEVRGHFKAIAEDNDFTTSASHFQGQEFVAESDDNSAHSRAEAAFADHLKSECTSFAVLLLGPATNFTRYADLFDGKIWRVVWSTSVQQRIPRDDSFNCVYDWSSCMRLGFMKREPEIEFAYIPYHGPFVVDADLLYGLNHNVIGKALFHLHQLETSWCTTSLWDDAASLYFLRLVPFVETADGLEIPDVSAVDFDDAEEKAITGSRYPRATTAPTTQPKSCPILNGTLQDNDN
jgi:hypothetical protein